MAARKRAQERDFNRRRWMILDKGIDMAYNQKETALGECLLKWNVREESALQRRQKMLARQGDISVGFKEQEKKLFVVMRDQATREPTLLLERTPSAEQYPGHVDLNQPRYMRPLNSRQSKTPEFATFSVFQAVKRRKRNPWEEAVKEAVQFRPTLCPCPRLNRQDTEKLLTDWAVVNEKQTKALGLRTDNRSAPVKQVRTGLNPLNLPPRLNSQLHHLAHDLLDDISTAETSTLTGDTDSCARSEGGEEIKDIQGHEEEEDQSQQEARPSVFVTQLSTQPERTTTATPPQQQVRRQAEQRKPQLLHHHQHHQQQQQLHQPHQELVVFEARDNTKKEKQMAHKQQVDSALISIYDMLDQRRAVGQPRLRNQQHQQQQQASRIRAAGRARITYYDHRHTLPATADSRQSAGTGTTALTTTTASSNSFGGLGGSSYQSRVSTAATGSSSGRMQQQQQQQQLRTTCRTAESIRILAESRRHRTRQQRRQLHSAGTESAAAADQLMMEQLNGQGEQQQ